MDVFSLLRMMGGLLVVLGLLAGALWVVRRYDLRLPVALGAGLRGRGAAPRLAVVERLSLDTRRSVALIRRDGLEHLVLMAPEGVLTIESGIAAVRDTQFQEEVDRHADD